MNVWNDNCTTGNKKGEAARERVKQNTKKQTITGNEGDVVGGVWRCQDAEKCADVKEKEQREGKKERRRSGPLGSLSATPRPPSLFSPFTSRQSPLTTTSPSTQRESEWVCVSSTAPKPHPVWPPQSLSRECLVQARQTCT